METTTRAGRRVDRAGAGLSWWAILPVMDGRHRTLGGLVARGNTSDVWRWSAGTVVKVLRPGIPGHWATLEADITTRVHEAGLPAPATKGMVVVDGRQGIVFEHIEGISMWDRMKAFPNELPALVEALVDLQACLHAAAPVEGLPDLVTRLKEKIAAAKELQAAERRHAVDLLASLPVASALCHGDLHPANILMSPKGMVLIDWFDAAAGHPLADLARSSLLMRPPVSVMSAHRYLAGATHLSLARLHDAYLTVVAKRGLVPQPAFPAWEAVLAVARMAEPVPTADLVGIWQAWRAGSRITRGRTAEAG
jgi:aminoglycoside phosphotransferase (APT) family kinase protein